MNKRGQELSLNTLIVIILLVIVLIVVAVFFLGGTSSLSRSIRSIFYGTTIGTDRNLAIEICNQRCNDIKGLSGTLPGSEAIASSQFCKQVFQIDVNGDGNIGDDEFYSCSKSIPTTRGGKNINTEPLSVICVDVTCP